MLLLFLVTDGVCDTRLSQLESLYSTLGGIPSFYAWYPEATPPDTWLLVTGYLLLGLLGLVGDYYSTLPFSFLLLFSFILTLLYHAPNLFLFLIYILLLYICSLSSRSSAAFSFSAAGI